MKKIGFFILAMLLLTITVIAQDVSDTEIESELTKMATPEGAEVRLNQLELSLERQVENAKEIKAKLGDSTDVDEKMAALEILLERVKAISPNAQPEDMAAEFVAVKKEAITASQEFKKSAQNGFTAQKIEEVKAQVKAKQQERTNLLKAKLENKKDEYVMKKMAQMLKKVGSDNGVLEKYQNGELTKEQAKSMVKESLKTMTNEKKNQMKASVEQEKTETKAMVQEKKAEVNSKIEQKRNEVKSQIETKQSEIKANAQAKMAGTKTEEKDSGTSNDEKESGSDNEETGSSDDKGSESSESSSKGGNQ